MRLELVSTETRKMRAVGVMESLKHHVNDVNALAGTHGVWQRERPCNTTRG